MSITRIIPKSAPAVKAALQNAWNKSETFANKDTMPLPRDVYDRLVVYFPILEREMRELNVSEVSKTGVSLHKWLAFDRTVMFCSHYFIAFNNGIHRGVFPVNHRQFYNIDVNDSRVPVIKNETELQKWAGLIKAGDADRITAGGKPMTNPTAAEVETEFQLYFALGQEQSTLKDSTNKEQEDVSAILDQGILLVTDIFDEIEHKYRHDDDSSKRAKCREWGVTYKVVTTGTGEEPLVPLTGTVAPLKSVTIQEGGLDANTSKWITNTGEVPLQFYTSAKAGETVPDTVLELAPGMQKEVFISELGAEGNTFLMVYNPDEGKEGSYEVVEGE
jgi:hypothetical protein